MKRLSGDLLCYPTHRAMKLRDGWGTGTIMDSPVPKSEAPGAPHRLEEELVAGET
jgi:hypothetical protein